MKNVSKEVIDDVLKLCSVALSKEDTLLLDLFPIALRAGRFPLEGFEWRDFEVEYVYSEALTPDFIKNIGFADIVPYKFADNMPNSVRNSIPQGLYLLHNIDFEKMQIWRDKQGDKMFEEQASDKTYDYQQGVLYLQRKNGQLCPLDLSNAPTLRPVFEAFFYLFEDTGRTAFSYKEVIESYKRITGRTIDKASLSDRKSSIYGKKIKVNDCLKNRIVWEYDKQKELWRFEILPLSDK